MTALGVIFILLSAAITFLFYKYITESKRAAESLRESEQRLTLAVSSGKVGIWEWDIPTGQLVWNEQLKAIFGLPSSITGLTLDKFISSIHPDDLEFTEQSFRDALQQQKEFKHEYRILWPDGSVHWILAIGHGIYDKAGNPLKMLGSALDTTERKQTEAKLQETNELFELFMRYSPVYTFIKEVTPIESRVMHASENFEQMVGIPGSEMVGKTMKDLFSDQFAAKITEDDWAVVSSGSVLKVDEDLNGRNYTTIKFPIIQTNKTLLAGFTIDITERKKMEEQIRQSQKLESIGTLAGGIAHDFNNLLQGIFGYISIAKLNAGNKDKSLAALEQAEKALHMSVNLTTQLLTFSKGGKPAKKKIPLQPVIENSVKFALSGSRVNYSLAFDKDLRHVDADEGQVGQVIQNIVLNADQAMPEGGTIVISAKNIHSMEKGEYIKISIQDNGIGIPENYMQKIFDPYFTTKEKGSGLGLATCYSIIKNHGGFIDVRSEPGKGTIFSVYLPAVEKENMNIEPTDVSSVVRKGKVLIMDDDELVRNIGRELLKELGHDVDTAEHGEAAIKKYKESMESGSPFDIVILDLTIRGGMGGIDTIEQLLAVNPEIKAIVSSGYADNAAVSDHHDYGFSACLSKPYKFEDLRDALNKLLG